jgi:multidrug efflux pump
VFGMNIDLVSRTVDIGGPSTQWWTQLSTAIAGGLTFATMLTLVLTPCLLLLGDRVQHSFPAWLRSLARRFRKQQLASA